MQWEILELAIRAGWLEHRFVGSEQAKISAVAFALLDVVNACLQAGLIDTESADLPADLRPYLRGVYRFLGDPLVP